MIASSVDIFCYLCKAASKRLVANAAIYKLTYYIHYIYTYKAEKVQDPFIGKFRKLVILFCFSSEGRGTHSIVNIFSPARGKKLEYSSTSVVYSAVSNCIELPFARRCFGLGQ